MEFFELSTIATHYLNAVEFTECGPDADDDMREGSFSHTLITRINRDVLKFYHENTDLCEAYVQKLGYAQFGHDLWLTRNGHGVGFWDRGLGELGNKLTEACKKLGSHDVYCGDDGFIYCGF